MKRICSICEAGCGLVIEANGRDVVGISANADDAFSGGHICAKGIALKELHADGDRLRTPLIRRDGALKSCTWDEALEFVAERLGAIRAESSPNAVAAYIGNPTAHNIGLAQGMGALLGQLGSTNIFSAGTVDQVPKHIASVLMFGNEMAIPVPDITRSDCLVMLGANPIVSNGSLWMVPGFRDKLRAFRERGGKFVVVDPRRTETASLADRHLFVRPGTDAFLLAGVLNALVASGREPAPRFALRGWEELVSACAGIGFEAITDQTGIAEAEVRSLAALLDESSAPVVYGRVGTTLQRHGTLTSFLIEAINMLLGALDHPGGAMFAEQPYSEPTARGGLAYNRWQSRVSGYPEVQGQMPCAALAEEIETPGEGQIRALFCFAGNPLVSNPDSDRLSRALESLDLLVCTDIYHNETTRLADVVLPGTSPFEDCHYDSFLGSMGWRNVARFSPALFEPEEKSEWDLCLTLGYAAAHGRAPTPRELRDYDDSIFAAAVARYTNDPNGPLFERDVQEIVGMSGPDLGVERMLDLGIRAGRWGDHFGEREGLSLQTLIDTPDGVDLGELRPDRLDEVLHHADAKLDMAPSVVLDELAALADEPRSEGLQLIGRRHVSTNNSWLGNLPMLTRGQDLCVAWINPIDADAANVEDGERVRLCSAIAEIEVPVKVTDSVMAGCVSLPHGFSTVDGIDQSVRRMGANYNALAPASVIDRPSGTSALNGIEVSVERLGD